MTWTKLIRRYVRPAAPLCLLMLAGGAAGCGNLLEVDDPTAVLESEVNDAQGAQLLWRSALTWFYQVVGRTARQSGLLADEFFYQRSATDLIDGQEQLDRRALKEYGEYFVAQGFGPLGNTQYVRWQELRLRYTPVAISKLLAYATPGARGARAGEMFAVRGYATMRLAEDICPGFPLHETVDFKVVYGPPRSTEQAFERALADFDSAVTWAADSARVLNFARVGRARTLLQLGRFAEAASAVADVPTGYVYQTEQSTLSSAENNLLWSNSAVWGTQYSVADREGGNGLDFVTANDPRVPRRLTGTALDGTTQMYALDKYPSRLTPIVVASGREARLIEAEAKLRENPDNLQWLAILNALRAASSDTTLSNHPLTDPGTLAARIDLLFRERAFWLFATGTRLGDLRRLIRHYGRSSDSVFPTGAYWRDGVYGTGTADVMDGAELISPGVTGCTSW